MTIFCSGIGGIGLSAYASLQRMAGHEVCGSDRSDSALLQSLREQGIGIALTQDGSALPTDCDLFVYSEAIAVDAPERVRARERGVRSLSYFQALGELSRGYSVIAVCGTHGKSSTTAMAARVMIEAGLDPTVVVGTKVRELEGKNFRKGKSNLFLLEACEYRRSFHFLSPSIVLMTNVDGDHFDAFPTIEAYREAFADFLALLPEDGVVITHGSDPDARALAEHCGRRFIDADAFPLVSLQTPGLHMRQNAQLVLALAAELRVPAPEAVRILGGFAGTWRRMEVVGERSGVTVIDDYAHHPREIRATLAALREAYPGRRMVTAFQPHTHDRTLKLYDDFCTAFRDTDVVVVAETYDARSDIETQRVDTARFTVDIGKGSGVEALYGGSLPATEQLLRSNILKHGDVLVCMGAGDVTKLAGRMMKN